MKRVPAALAALALLAPPTAPVADAQVRRCELADGQTVYTDRRCEMVGGVERRNAPPQARMRNWRSACPRTVRDLYFEVSAAIESSDVNRLAGVYHWTGMSNRQGYDVMRRLQAIVDRPLVDLQPVWAGGEESAYLHGRAPVGFRIEQTTGNGITPVRATLGLRRHLDCWWVTLGAPRSAPPRPEPAIEVVDAPARGDLADEAPVR